MIYMHSKYDNVHTNGIINALNFINNHVNSCINCTLSEYQRNILMICELMRKHDKGSIMAILLDISTGV